MNLSKQTLLNLLNGCHPHFYLLKKNDEGFLNPNQLAHLYINSALLVTVMKFIKESLWLKNREDKTQGNETSYNKLIISLFQCELSPILFLKEFIVKEGTDKIKKISLDSLEIRTRVIELITNGSNEDKKIFITQCLKEMTTHFLHEENLQNGRQQSLGHKGPCLYRTFDSLDEIFSLNYDLDKKMKIDHSTEERLYQGSGASVQSGYSTILLALHHAQVKRSNHVIDLGSGYGRVGLVFSILREDIFFTGYEYVAHRVDVSNNTSKNFGLQNYLHYKTQDLFLESFNIPDADIYYLYDPFSEKTYKKVLKQIVAVSLRQKVTIITKGNARHWLVDLAKKNSWPEPKLIDEGNLCIFTSSL